MVNPEDVMKRVRHHTNHILRFARIGLSPDQYKAFEMCVWEQLGERGLGRDLDRLFNSADVSAAQAER